MTKRKKSSSNSGDDTDPPQQNVSRKSPRNIPRKHYSEKTIEDNHGEEVQDTVLEASKSTNKHKKSSPTKKRRVLPNIKRKTLQLSKAYRKKKKDEVKTNKLSESTSDEDYNPDQDVSEQSKTSSSTSNTGKKGKSGKAKRPKHSSKKTTTVARKSVDEVQDTTEQDISGIDLKDVEDENINDTELTESELKKDNVPLADLYCVIQDHAGPLKDQIIIEIIKYTLLLYLYFDIFE